VAARDPTSSTTPSESDKLTIRDIALQIRSERGLAGFWAGYSASIILTLNPAITFAADNVLRRLLPKAKRDKPGPQLTFLLAAVSKALATSVTYPVSLAKSRAQAKSSTPVPQAEGTKKKAPLPEIPGVTVERTETVEKVQEKAPVSNDSKQKAQTNAQRALRLLNAQYAIFVSLQRIYKEEGIGGLYSGIEGEVLKGFLSHGLTMVVKERAHIGVIQTYYLLLRLSKRWPDDAQSVAAEAKERAENIGVTVAEGAKQALNEGKKVLG
jgi:hypothetical protein